MKGMKGVTLRENDKKKTSVNSHGKMHKRKSCQTEEPCLSLGCAVCSISYWSSFAGWKPFGFVNYQRQLWNHIQEGRNLPCPYKWSRNGTSQISDIKHRRQWHFRDLLETCNSLSLDVKQNAFFCFITIKYQRIQALPTLVASKSESCLRSKR